MKKRWLPLLTALLAIVMLLCPLVKLQVHSQIAPETAAQFPVSLSLGQVMLQGAKALPTSVAPAFLLAQFGQGYLLAGLIVMAVSAVVALVKKPVH